MRFNLIDRIVEVRPASLRAIKLLTLGEEYLGDHFPGFPVMPGVLMLQTLVESASWLLRVTEDFRHSVIVLREVKNIKYGSFMEPGKQLEISVDLVERGNGLAVFKGKGECQGEPTVSARFTLASYNLADRDPALKVKDDQIIRQMREQAGLLIGVAASAPTGHGERGT